MDFKHHFKDFHCYAANFICCLQCFNVQFSGTHDLNCVIVQTGKLLR